MWTVKVVLWWLLVLALAGLQRVLVWLLYLPMTALEACCDGRDAAEIEWLLACTQMRLARRRRVNLSEVSRVNLQEVADGQRS